RRPRAGDLRQLPAQEARRQRPVADPHRARRRLHAQTPASMIVSLRGRLVAGVLALAACGLILLAAVTYIEQRSFLINNVDRQVRSAQPVVDMLLEGQGFDPRGHGFPHGGPRPGDGPPPGTYVQRRPANGEWSGRFVLYQEGGTAPSLPADLPLDKIVTVNADG